MKLKQKPEDFVVTESWRFDKVASGEFRVYQMDKQKVSTFDAIGRIAETFRLPRSVFSYCGLKDKQGRTTQLIAVRGVDVDMQDEDLRLKYLGRTDEPLTARNTTSNRFGVTVRDLSEPEVARLPEALAEVNRLGVVNYFDSQRFGSLKHGQGFIAKDLLRGDFEAALKNHLARPSDLDKSNDAKVKAFWRDHWGEWKRRCTIPGANKYQRILDSLRREPKDFRRAFLQIDAKYRAMLVFTYQSYLWNEGVRRFLISMLPGQSLLALNYQAGKLLFPRDAPPEVAPRLRDQFFPLLAPDSKIEDPDVRKAVEWVLGREKLTLDKLVVPETPEIFFKHEDRPLLVYPGKLMMGSAHRDELNKEMKKVYVAFTLPPGSYATLVIRRLFWFSQQRNAEHDDLEAALAEVAPKAGDKKAVEAAARPAATPAPEGAPAPAPLGFRARQKQEKERKAKARQEASQRRAPRR